MRLRIRAVPTPEKPSQSIPKKRRQKIPPLKEGRRSAERRTTGPHRKAMRRAPGLRFLRYGRIEAGQASWSGRARLSAPHRGIRGFHPRLGLGRASWNHRMQTGGPSPAPVQRAPRGPARAGRDDAQAARGARCMAARHENRSRSASRSTLAKGVLRERDGAYVTVVGTNVKGNVALLGTTT
jgi:hypothetical protein